MVKGLSVISWKASSLDVKLLKALSNQIFTHATAHVRSISIRSVRRTLRASTRLVLAYFAFSPCTKITFRTTCSIRTCMNNVVVVVMLWQVCACQTNLSKHYIKKSEINSKTLRLTSFQKSQLKSIAIFFKFVYACLLFFLIVLNCYFLFSLNLVVVSTVPNTLYIFNST